MSELIGRYGGEKHLQVPEDIKTSTLGHEDIGNREMIINKGVYENKEQDKGILGVKSKYEEDVFENGHSSVWGSYWHP